MLTMPNLHLIGEQFLPRVLSVGFDAVVVLLFISLAIGYALAGSQAYSDALHFRLVTLRQ